MSAIAVMGIRLCSQSANQDSVFPYRTESRAVSSTLRYRTPRSIAVLSAGDRKAVEAKAGRYLLGDLPSGCVSLGGQYSLRLSLIARSQQHYSIEIAMMQKVVLDFHPSAL